MIDWATVSALATAGGTLVLAVATCASVRSANRAARAAERPLLAGLRPLLMPSRLQDPPEKVNVIDGHCVVVPGGCGAVEASNNAVYLALSLHNAGNGIAVLHGWEFFPERVSTHGSHPPGTTPSSRRRPRPARSGSRSRSTCSTATTRAASA